MKPRIVAVIDLKGGLAVHARGNRREEYQPVQSILLDGADPLSLALAYRDALGIYYVYVADLDAIEGIPPSLDFYRAAADAGLRLIVDPGPVGRRRLNDLLAAGVDSVVVATETLRGPSTLGELIQSVEPDRLIFGLDLRGGRPILAVSDEWIATEPIGLIETALEAGFLRVLILDLARVGAGEGVATLALASEVVRRHPYIEVAIGGGVAGRADLEAAGRAGVHAVLVGSALLDGRLTRDDVAT